jgi:hypothetical protein
MFYLKLIFKLVKFSNFEIPIPNFAAPSSQISFELINISRFITVFYILCQHKFKLNRKLINYLYKLKVLHKIQIKTSQLQ